ncbi:hypothetical protein V6N11_005283 [Hibiscus sabdariffa]|uniref:Uncharacterized protein n=2 Tax=Hibiscus sabdariffa TaxID=183260 RepID=A0ABR2RMF3_9ROSI
MITKPKKCTDDVSNEYLHSGVVHPPASLQQTRIKSERTTTASSIVDRLPFSKLYPYDTHVLLLPMHVGVAAALLAGDTVITAVLVVAVSVSAALVSMESERMVVALASERVGVGLELSSTVVVVAVVSLGRVETLAIKEIKDK